MHALSGLSISRRAIAALWTAAILAMSLGRLAGLIG